MPETRTERMERRFLEYHSANPHVYATFKKLALEALETGRTKYSARTIVHVIRWYLSMETSPTDDFKINDHWSPFYARLLAKEDKRFREFFEFRYASADDAENYGGWNGSDDETQREAV